MMAISLSQTLQDDILSKLKEAPFRGIASQGHGRG
jgi:hypothetical protein